MRTLSRLAIALLAGWLVIFVALMTATQLLTRDQMRVIAPAAVLGGLGTAAALFYVSRNWGFRKLTPGELESGFDIHFSLPFLTFLVVIGLPSAGLMAFPFWMQSRRWPKRVDREGITLRNGQLLRWTDINDISHGVKTMGGTPINTWWDLRAGEQQASIVVNSLVEGKEVVEFAWRHLPDPVKVLAAAYL